MLKFWATIRTQWGDVKVTIDAPNQHAARALIEAQYGKGKILGDEVKQC
tara:strand:+ start:174 stop:320 length:147 start_codon:yes stop_codon:yes gene_type:complete